MSPGLNLVGCVPSAAVAVCPGRGEVSAWQGGCLPGRRRGGLPGRGCLPRGEGVSAGGGVHTSPSPWTERQHLWKHNLSVADGKNNQSGSYSVQDLRLNSFSVFDHFEGKSSLLWFQILILIDFIPSIDRLSILFFPRIVFPLFCSSCRKGESSHS